MKSRGNLIEKAKLWVEKKKEKQAQNFSDWLDWNEENQTIPPENLAKIRKQLSESDIKDILKYLTIAGTYDIVGGIFIKAWATKNGIQNSSALTGLLDFIEKYGIKLAGSYFLTLLLVRTVCKEMNTNNKEALRVIIPPIGTLLVAEGALDKKNHELWKALKIYYTTRYKIKDVRKGILSKDEYLEDIQEKFKTKSFKEKIKYTYLKTKKFALNTIF